MRERRGRLRGQLTRVDHVKSAGVTLLHVTHHETGGRQKIALRSKFPREQATGVATPELRSSRPVNPYS